MPHAGSPAQEPVVEFRHIRKAFDATVALDDVSFSVAPGEVCALLGANGAGKSTLIKLLAGVHRCDSGEIVLAEAAAGRAGAVEFIHQDLGLIPTMTVAENIALTRGYRRRAGAIDWRGVQAAARKVLATLGADISVDAEVGRLSRADQSLVAIARAIHSSCRLLVMDEPTASLPDADVDRLFATVERLRGERVGVIYVTHRLDEVFRIADRVVVLRDGRLVADGATADLSPTQLVESIVGSAPVAHRPAERTAGGAAVLQLSGVRLRDGADAFDIDVRPGEVLGLAGLRGAGQEELGRALAAVEDIPFREGQLEGVPLVPGAHRQALRRRIGFASSRREAEGLAMTLTVQENIFMNPGAASRRPLSWLRPGDERRRAQDVGAQVALHPNRPEIPAGTLSGGNQQKVVLGRWLALSRAALLLEEPTMGIDVGARADIYRLISEAAGRGMAIIVVSSDFEELAMLCQRVVVLDGGAVVAEYRGEDITARRLTYAASGGDRSTAPEVVA